MAAAKARQDPPGRAVRRAPAALPAGAQWRRAEEQLAMRLGAFPGDQVALIAPASHDPSTHFAQRLPRVHWLHFGDDDRFGWAATPRPTGFTRIRADILDPPLREASVESLITVLGVPLLTIAEHTELVAAWCDLLKYYGKWLSLIAVDGANDPRLAGAQRDLKDAGFTRVRAQRLALGRMGSHLVLVSARRGDEDEAEDEAGEDDEE